MDISKSNQFSNRMNTICPAGPRQTISIRNGSKTEFGSHFGASPRFIFYVVCLGREKVDTYMQGVCLQVIALLQGSNRHITQ